MIDRFWYTFLPIAVYLAIAWIGVTLASHNEDSLNLLAFGLVLLLVIGIRNAWDMTVWIIDRRKS
jgi:hypothetical protein